MGEDDIVELLWKNGQVVQSSQTQRPASDKPSPPPPPPHPPILRGSGSGCGEENVPLPQPPSPPPMHHQNLFIQEDEMASWLHHSYSQDYCLYSGVGSTPATHQQSSFSLAQPPSFRYILQPERPTSQILASGRVEEAGPSVVQVGSSASTSSSATESCVLPPTEGTERSLTCAVPGPGPKGKAVAIETAATLSSGVCKVDTEQRIPAMETEIVDDRKRNEREETIAEFQETKEAGTSRKRSRTAEMHNLSERRRREKINEKMKTLQELIPRCTKSDKASLLEDVIQHVKSLEMQIQMMSTGQGMMPPTMYAGNMQPFMLHMAMGMNRPPPFIPFPGTPFPRPGHMAGLGPSYPAPLYPFPNIQTFDPSRVHLPSPQPNPVSNQPQFPGYMNLYSQFVGLHQTQQPPPPLQSQTTSQVSFGQASSSKEPDDEDNQPTG